MDDYIFVVGDLKEFVDLVNEKMNDYNPFGGPVFFPQTTTMGQAMIRKRVKMIGCDYGAFRQEGAVTYPNISLKRERVE